MFQKHQIPPQCISCHAPHPSATHTQGTLGAWVTTWCKGLTTDQKSNAQVLAVVEGMKTGRVYSIFPTSPTSLFSACNSEVFQASQVSKVGRSKCRSVFLQLNEQSTPKQATGLSVQLSHPKLVQKTSRGGVRPFFSWDLRLQRQTPFLCHRDGIRRHLRMVPIPPGRRPNCWCVVKLTGPRPVTGYSVDRFQELALRENWPDITDLITHDFILNMEKRNV